jgi:hypothetical protein
MMGRWEEGGKNKLSAAGRAKKGFVTGFEGRFRTKNRAEGRFRCAFWAVLGGRICTPFEHVRVSR